ncbi:hypothetical protein [Liquorilactobacillus uvarum]|uniref:Uncharacterized protein n=1 Tax=Liquorilactobacillus uvarum DSM 19971 TaxID=1423812 RepID=A0A0R1PYI9_9LACO|nr:hypothetical protein [Liquorilactobacillus uvarum]KRL37340.1 hypothetical protein FD20_GL000522 [Liquorilactobacillus uvarum DSM 19971]
MKGANGHLIYSGMMGIFFLGMIFSAQTLYYHEQILGYQNLKNYNIARTMRNLALANRISNNEVMWFNQGSVTKKSEYFVIKMNNRKPIELKTLVKYDLKYQEQKLRDLK